MGEPLAAELAKTDAAIDEEAIKLARQLLALADPEGARSGKYIINISGGQGIVIGDNATTTMKFD
ncbi:MAG TPA: hypothetical protein VFP34_17745 [Microlunatus sp.]|nr:hypothetical protein [Microlunatus sp.]